MTELLNYSGHIDPYSVITAEEERIEYRCENIPEEDKARILRVVNARDDILFWLERAIGLEAGYGLWGSDSLHSWVIMFDPDKVEREDHIDEDWRDLAMKASILMRIIGEDPAFARCPDDSATEVYDALSKVKAVAERKGGLK